MTSPRTRLLTLALLVGAILIWWDAATMFGQDDPLNYAKTSGAILGEPLPDDPAERAFIDRFPPTHYEPHPGINLPYIEFPAEYPPLAMLFFLLPRFVSSSFPGYVLAFATQMTLLVALMGWLLWRINRKLSTSPLGGWQATPLTCLFFIGGGFLICRRFDVAAVVFVALAVAAELSARTLLAGLLLGLGAATKLWPGFLLPLFLLSSLADGDRGRLLTTGGGFAAGFLGPHLPFVLLGGSKAFS